MTTPPIPGLFFDPAVLVPTELAAHVLQQCMDTYFRNNNANQVMLFGRARDPSDASPASGGGLPPFLHSLLHDLDGLFRPVLPPETHRLLFPPSDAPARARQAIINLYRPGEGISPHVDLLRRFGDGIIGVSLGSGCVMDFCRAQGGGGSEMWDVYLPERSVLVLSGEARYGWTHGIEGRLEDQVEKQVLEITGPDARVRDESSARGSEWLQREVRLSITFRWLLPGAEVVGGMSGED
ncbi:hypothetical protein BV25DRAFT_1866504 [Artomyces pyxidatus]|uniref:Uncharacterized protein n=1 Tax=Artomyces pyxidatus TaxID=48021 RepID=A0ACB8TJ45_9AGAM|nr:hypothetical protein BV25DRAFT_1866504 [Artomyces pyxidatus]